MSIEETLNYIELLKTKIRFTSSMQLKRMYMINIIFLIDYLRHSHFYYYEDETLEESILYRNAMEHITKESVISTVEFLEVNQQTKRLSSNVINLYEQHHYYPSIYSKEENCGIKRLNKLLIEFIHSLGDNVFKKYEELLDSGIEESIADELVGVCWDFFAINKQVIGIDFTRPIDYTVSVVHELGHAMSMDAINKVGKKKLNGSNLKESISILFEVLYLKFLEENNVNIKCNYRRFCNDFLGFSLRAKAGSIAVNKRELIDFDGQILYSNELLQPQYVGYYSEYYGKPLFIDYIEPLFYFYGSLIALKFSDLYKKDSAEAVKKMNEFLFKAETRSVAESLEEIELNKVPNALVRTLKKTK